MQFLCTEYENSLADFKKEQKDLVELQEHFEKLNAENQRVQKEKELDALRAQLRDEEKKRLGDAARVVQAFWKGIILQLHSFSISFFSYTVFSRIVFNWPIYSALLSLLTGMAMRIEFVAMKKSKKKGKKGKK